MARAALITRVVKPTFYFAALLPLSWLLFALLTGRVTGDEVKFMQHVTGDTVLSCLMLTLAMTPLRRLTGWNEIMGVRRLIGLTAFWYACMHLSTYLVFDQSLSIDEISKDIVKHPWVLVGFTAFLCLVPLAITSTRGWVRRLGGKRWQRLHRLVYVAAAAGVLHYFWLVKKDVQAPPGVRGHSAGAAGQPCLAGARTEQVSPGSCAGDEYSSSRAERGTWFGGLGARNKGVSGEGPSLRSG